MDEAEVGSLSDSRFAALLDRLLAVRWPLPAEDVGPLVESWGWPVTWAGEDGACRADPDYGLATSSPAHFYTSEDKLRSVVVSTSDDVPDLTDDALTALDDAFARHVAIARERLGEPDRRGQGRIASVTWFLPDGRLVQVVRGTTGGWIEMATPDPGELHEESDV